MLKYEITGVCGGGGSSGLCPHQCQKQAYALEFQGPYSQNILRLKAAPNLQI